VSLMSASVKVIWTCNHLEIMLLLLSLVLKGQVGATDDGVYGFEGWETG
jgi:hypothetical protein